MGGAHRLRLTRIARDAEEAGFSSLWLMDHVVQIPQVGRVWEDLPESYTTLGYLAAATTRIRLGALVTNVGFRNLGHLAKIVATLDVLSGGRAMCGLGAGWYEREVVAYGWEGRTAAQRLDLLEDALRLLPLMWGAGSPAFDGKSVRVAEAVCYPRPLQARIPLLVGGGGERRTLRLVAELADACNLTGDPATVRRKLEVLARHCAAVGRERSEIEVTHLLPLVLGEDRAGLRRTLDRLRPARQGIGAFAAAANAGTVDEHAERCELLAECGVDTVIVAPADLDDPAAVPRYHALIERFA